MFNQPDALARNPNQELAGEFSKVVPPPGQGRKTLDALKDRRGGGIESGGGGVIGRKEIEDLSGGGGGDPNYLHGNPGAPHPMPNKPQIPPKPGSTVNLNKNSASSVMTTSSSSTSSSAGGNSAFQIKKDGEEQSKDKQKMTKKDKKTGRIQFEYEGRIIYEWEQTIDDVSIYIKPPPEVTRQMLNIKISHLRLTVGLHGCPPFVDEPSGGPIKADESTWMLVDGEVIIILQKMNKAEVWDCALAGKNGQTVDAFTKEELKKKMMLERFQEEHPGFDFSGAEFNGEIPNAREFMGGVRRS